MKRFLHLLSYSSLTSFAVPTWVQQVRELIWLNINPEVKNTQLSFSLAQIWLYVYPQVGTKEAMAVHYQLKLTAQPPLILSFWTSYALHCNLDEVLMQKFYV